MEAQFAPIAGDLQDCLDITANLLTVAGRYLDEGELGELTDSRAALAESGGITEAHAAYERLLGDAETVFLKLEDCVLSGRDADYVKGFRTDLAAEQDTIARDGYNAAADRYNERVLGASPPECWGRSPLCARRRPSDERSERHETTACGGPAGRGSPDGGPGRGGSPPPPAMWRTRRTCSAARPSSTSLTKPVSL